MERSGGESYSGEKEKSVEIHHEAIDRLLARLVEASGDLSSSSKASIRTQIQAHLSAMGLKSLEQWREFGIILAEKRRNIPTPDDYPSKEEFRERIADLVEGRIPTVYDTEGADLLASSVALFGETNWAGVRPRRETIEDYLYDLGKVMCSEFHYEVEFDNEKDAIQVTSDWQIDVGRHRSFVLRVLGSTYVQEKGMDAWVKVRKAS